MKPLGGIPFAAADVVPAPDTGSREWFTAAELAELALPGLPSDKRSLNRRANGERWHQRCTPEGEALARRRQGRGGGQEFHVSLLPGSARLELAARGVVAAPAPVVAEPAAVSGWRWYDAQSAKTKATAEHRARILAELDLLEDAGMTRTAAIAETKRRHGVSPATLWNWLNLVDGVARQDRLPALAPRHRGGGNEAEIDGDLWNILLSDWMRLEAPTLTSCYDRTAAIAAARGLSLPSERSIRRKIDREVDPRAILLARGGAEKLERGTPDNRRTLDGHFALDLVNIDGHVFDVWVKPRDGGKPVRPVMTAIQDVYSRKMLAWRLDFSENVLVTRLVFADLFQNFGIPKQCLLDNSRTFASKALTSGAATRYRGKIRDEDPAGLLPSLGIQVRFAQIYHGQSKPIERAFRDIADRISRAPECAGAYTGNSPVNKPANYGSRAVPWDEFEAIVAKGIAAHNAKAGRRGGVSRGRSFDDVFAESYATAPIGKTPTPEQLRIALLAVDQKRVNSRTGEVELFGNRYWSPECGRFLGQVVTVRFDPDELHKEVHLYDQGGHYLTSADVIADHGFTDVAGARAASERKKSYRKLVKAVVEAEQLRTAAEVAALQVDPVAPALPEPAVIRPVRHRGTNAALKAMPAPAPVQSQQESRVFSALRLVGPLD